MERRSVKTVYMGSLFGRFPTNSVLLKLFSLRIFRHSQFLWTTLTYSLLQISLVSLYVMQFIKRLKEYSKIHVNSVDIKSSIRRWLASLVLYGLVGLSIGVASVKLLYAKLLIVGRDIISGMLISSFLGLKYSLFSLWKCNYRRWAYPHVMTPASVEAADYRPGDN